MKPADEPLILFLQKVIHFSVRLLAILMTFVIFWGVFDVIWELYQRLMQPPIMLLDISDILATFGAFLAVLIAIEIFINITIYLKEEVIHVKIVLATALMAIARKVIIFDFKELEPSYIFATAAVVLSLSIGYWLVIVYGREGSASNENNT
ncbi:MAG: phosphate-starvation-inducible PsiE family protein [Candidatus Omnitrophica bacterium]|nr:phosphate-starvation-inducible PsiE family protein [Candidatus Omnitrophota bacterium]